jgi:hypothetical protein
MVPFARVRNVYGDDPNVVPGHIDRKQDMVAVGSTPVFYSTVGCPRRAGRASLPPELLAGR